MDALDRAILKSQKIAEAQTKIKAAIAKNKQEKANLKRKKDAARQRSIRNNQKIILALIKKAGLDINKEEDQNLLFGALERVATFKRILSRPGTDSTTQILKHKAKEKYDVFFKAGREFKAKLLETETEATENSTVPNSENTV